MNQHRRPFVILIIFLIFASSSDVFGQESEKLSSLWLRNSYLKFKCEDSLAARYVVLHNNSPIYPDNGYCLMNCSQRISLADSKIESVGADSIVIYQIYRQKITFDNAQIDFSRSRVDGMQNSDIMNIDLVKKREQREQMQAAFGIAGAILLFAGIIYVVNNVEIDFWKMPDP